MVTTRMQSTERGVTGVVTTKMQPKENGVVGVVTTKNFRVRCSYWCGHNNKRVRARIWSTLSVGDRTVRSSAEQDKVNEVLVWSHLRAGQRSFWCGHTLEVLEADEVAGVVTT